MPTFRDVAAELRPFFLPGINAVSGLSESGIASWTKGGSYQIANPPSPSSFKLVPLLPNDGLAEAFAAEVRRFSLAAFETCIHNERDRTVPRALAWSSISSYYASYFAAHAICRMFGRSVSQLESRVTNAVADVASSYLGGSHIVGSGLYSVQFQSNSGVVEYNKSGGTGGSHELLWKMFLELLNDLESSILTSRPSTPEIQSVCGYLTDLGSRLKSKGSNGGNWLSVVRNDINYRQEHGVWFPYGISASSADVVDRRLKSWLREDSSWSSSLSANTLVHCAVDLGMSIISLLFWLLQALGARTTVPKSFVKQSSFALLRLQASGDIKALVARVS